MSHEIHHQPAGSSQELAFSRLPLQRLRSNGPRSLAFDINARNARERQIKKMLAGSQNAEPQAIAQETPAEAQLDVIAIISSPQIPMEAGVPVAPAQPAGL